MASCLHSCTHPNARTSMIVLLLLSFAFIPGGVSFLHALQSATPADRGPIFSRGQTYSTAGYISNSVAVGDFNGDGNLDIVVTNQCQDFSCSKDVQGTVTARLGKGDGTFGGALISNAGNGAPFSVAVGDFNRDGKPDLGLASICNFDVFGFPFGEVHGLLGNGDGTFNNFYALGGGGPCPYAVAIGDFNLDGNLDMAVALYCIDSFTCTDGFVGVYLGTGDGNFLDPVFYSYGGGHLQSIKVGDFNGDGKPDLAVGDGGPETVTVLLGNGDGTFRIGAPFAFSINFVVGDFNGDDKSDLVGVSGNNLVLLLGNDDATFQPPITLNASPGVLAAADFNCDRKLDITVFNSTGTTLLLGNGHGKFCTIHSSDLVGGVIAVGDFNNDGKPDLAADDGSRVTVFLNVLHGSCHAERNLALVLR